MSHTLIFILSGLGIAALGTLVFIGGTRLMDRQTKALGGFSSCLLALLGVVIIFAGVGILAAAALLP